MTREVEARLKISAVDKTGRVLKNVGDKLEHVNGRAEQYNRSMGIMGRVGTAAMGRLMLMSASGFAAAGAGAIYATRQAAKFEDSLFAIQKKSGATKEEMEKLGKEIKDLATEMPVSVDEIASAFERGAAAGIPLDELREFAKLTAGVADAWETTAENVGNTFAGFTAGMGMARGDLEAYASLINDLADAGIADETGIADFIDRSGASLKNFGMTPEEIAAYGASLLNLKMPAEVAARAMDTITGKLLAPENLSPKAADALKGIVGDLDAFSKLSGNSKFTYFIEQVEKLGSQRRASLLGALLGEGFDDEIMRLVSGSDEMRRNLEMASKHVANPSTSIIDAQIKKLELFNSQLQIMQNHFSVIATDIGDKALPALTEVAERINETLDSGRARGRALENMSAAERGQQEEWFYKQLLDEEGGNVTRRQHNVAYQSALEMVGRGEIQDVYDYIDRLKTNNRYIREQNRPSNVDAAGNPVGRTSRPVRLRSEPSLAEQYSMYGRGQQAMQESEFGSSVRPDQKNETLAGIMANLDRLEKSGADTLRLGSEEAAQAMANGGKETADALTLAGSSFLNAVSEAAGRIVSAVQTAGRASAYGEPSPTAVRADTGRSMPASAGRPPGTGRQ